MRRYFDILILVTSMASFSAWSQNDAERQATWDIMNSSNDHLELVRKYWPRIRLGDVEAIVISYNAINNCWHFHDAIREADNIDALAGLLSDREASQVLFGESIYYQCKKLVERFGEFPGWNDLRLRAALAGHAGSKTMMGLNYYRHKNDKPREDIPFSPAGFLTEAMIAGDPTVFIHISKYGSAYGLRLEDSVIVSTAWDLLACSSVSTCREPKSMAAFCNARSPECGEARTYYDLIRRRAGSEADFNEAGHLADELRLKIQQHRFEELGLNLIW